jgi:hypothetical protein
MTASRIWKEMKWLKSASTWVFGKSSLELKMGSWMLIWGSEAETVVLTGVLSGVGASAPGKCRHNFSVNKLPRFIKHRSPAKHVISTFIASHCARSCHVVRRWPLPECVNHTSRMLRPASTYPVTVRACFLNDHHISAIGLDSRRTWHHPILGSGTFISEMKLRWEMIRKLAATKCRVAASCTPVILLCRYKRS